MILITFIIKVNSTKYLKKGLRIHGLTFINPLIIYVDRLTESVNRRLIVLQTNTTFHVANFFFLIAEFESALILFGKTYSSTSHEPSRLQNGQLKCLGNGSITLVLVGGLRVLFLRPMTTANFSTVEDTPNGQIYNPARFDLEHAE